MEIRILDFLKKLDEKSAPNASINVVHMIDHFDFRNHKCITFELLSGNLYELIKKNKFLGFEMDLVRKFAYAILRCLEALQAKKLIHCDLKPENILLKQSGRSGIKVIDFGSSCFESQRIYTYIQSRFYRAPEVILGCPYGMPIDMWSFGCILAELLTGYPIFPGEDEADQFAVIVELLGMPSAKMLQSSKRAKNFITSQGYPRYCSVRQELDGRVTLGPGKSTSGKKVRGPPASKTWSSALKNCGDELFIDFLKRCLQWDPGCRLSPTEALRHPWLRSRSNAAGVGRSPVSGQQLIAGGSLPGTSSNHCYSDPAAVGPMDKFLKRATVATNSTTKLPNIPKPPYRPISITLS